MVAHFRTHVVVAQDYSPWWSKARQVSEEVMRPSPLFHPPCVLNLCDLDCQRMAAKCDVFGCLLSVVSVRHRAQPELTIHGFTLASEKIG